MTEKIDKDSSDRQKLYSEYVSVFNEVWLTLSELEKSEYQRMHREVYAMLPIYYRALDKVSLLHKEGNELAVTVKKLLTRWIPISLAIVGCTLFFDIEFIRQIVSTGMILLLGAIGFKLYLQHRNAEDESEWEWRVFTIAATLGGYGLGHALLNNAWSLKKREESDFNFNSESIEALECHHEISEALLDSVRPGAILGVHFKRFASSGSEKSAGESAVER